MLSWLSWLVLLQTNQGWGEGGVVAGWKENKEEQKKTIERMGGETGREGGREGRKEGKKAYLLFQGKWVNLSNKFTFASIFQSFS